MNKMAMAATLAMAAAMAWAADPNPRFGMAGYTYHKQTADQMLDALQKLDVHWLCVKDFHLSYAASDAEIAVFKKKCADHGVTPYAVGPIYMGSHAEADRAFDFAKRLGVKIVVGVPYLVPEGGKDEWGGRVASRELCEYVSGLCAKYDVRYAIHNHGPDVPKLFPTGESAWEMVKDLDPRMGLCLDAGHDFRFGADPVASVRKYAPRLFDFHLKNVTEPTVKGSAMPLPRGKMDMAAIFKALRDVGYAGVCSLEYERDFTDNFAGIAECIGYFRGLSDMASEEEGFEPLWNGPSCTNEWVSTKGCAAWPSASWVVEPDGVLTVLPVEGNVVGPWTQKPPEKVCRAYGGDLVTRRKFRDFDFRVEFRLTAAANSGIKYFYDESVNNGTTLEYQILDPGHPDATKGRDGNRRVAALYDMMPAPAAAALVRPVGDWNLARVTSKGTHVEHWLNGVKVLEYERGGAAFAEAFKASKYSDKEYFDKNGKWGLTPEGRILLQNHADSTVSFRNARVKAL
ncbi:MAG: DUF1080 domain-containing protein, partial [Kiritimatiellae bacterium]|nr:DUF1080 domain-containing protein [Kiritimatiellia bacterium]